MNFDFIFRMALDYFSALSFPFNTGFLDARAQQIVKKIVLIYGILETYIQSSSATKSCIINKDDNIHKREALKR